VGGRVVDRRIAVRVEQALGELVLGEAGDLAEDVLCGFDVEVGVEALTEDVLAPEDFEEVELKVSYVALVVAHRVLRCSSMKDAALRAHAKLLAGHFHDATEQ
jgi:hypothetical protein